MSLLDQLEHVDEITSHQMCSDLFPPAVTQTDSNPHDSPSKAKTCAPVAMVGPDAQGTTIMENLVGSQKRKARKTKITHLVRTADGSVSPVEGEQRLMAGMFVMSSFCSLNRG